MGSGVMDARDEGADGRKVGAAHRQLVPAGHPHQRSLVAPQNRRDVAMRHPVRAMHLCSHVVELNDGVGESHEHDRGPPGGDRVDVVAVHVEIDQVVSDVLGQPVQEPGASGGRGHDLGAGFRHITISRVRERRAVSFGHGYCLGGCLRLSGMDCFGGGSESGAQAGRVVNDGAAGCHRQRYAEVDVRKTAHIALAGNPEYRIGDGGAGKRHEGRSGGGRHHDLVRLSPACHVQDRGAQGVAERPADQAAQPDVQKASAHRNRVLDAQGSGDGVDQRRADDRAEGNQKHGPVQHLPVRSLQAGTPFHREEISARRTLTCGVVPVAGHGDSTPAPGTPPMTRCRDSMCESYRSMAGPATSFSRVEER